MGVRCLILLLAAGLCLGCRPAKPSAKPPTWDKATLASCWNGANASQRMMNMLSVGMSEATLDAYLAWMKARGCNTAHVFLSNYADGPHALPGTSIYGTGKKWDWTVDDAVVAHYKARIKKIRDAKMAYVPWLFADDSSLYNATAKQNFPKYALDLKTAGLFKEASYVCLGLELDEYYNSGDVARLANSVRAVYPGKVAIHQTSYKYDFHPVADLVLYQIKPGATPARVKAEVAKVRAATGKPVCMFEMERSPARALCEAAFEAKAWSVGNW